MTTPPPALLLLLLLTSRHHRRPFRCRSRPDGELRCVLAVIRHGDRTPKQKMKLKVTQEPLLALLHTYMDSKGKQAKLKVGRGWRVGGWDGGPRVGGGSGGIC